MAQINTSAHTLGHGVANEKERKIWKSWEGEGGTDRERAGNVNRNASTRLSGRDKNTQKHVYTYINTRYITLLEVYEGSEKQG